VVKQVAALGVSATRIPLGVDVTTWAPRSPRRREPDERARLIHVASLNRVKDQATLLHAMRLLAQDGVPFALDIVGEDTLDGEIQKLARRLGLDAQVTFHGYRTPLQLRPFFDAAHLNLVTSRHEAGPLVLLEAAIAGVPSVSTDVGHASEWAPRAAWCVPVGDAPALARAVRILIGAEDQRLQLAERAQELALREDAVHGAALFEATYQRLLAS
jgi:glycosyltransferase involved in cell wall biosynthesis